MSEARNSSARRIAALVRKEAFQIVRDPSSILIAFVLPLILLVLFAYGVSLDLKGVRLGLVIESESPQARRLAESFADSPYFTLVPALDRREVQRRLAGGDLTGAVVIAGDFAARVGRGREAPLQVVVRGTDPNTAELVKGYVQGAWLDWLTQESLARGEGAQVPSGASAPVTVVQRVWFNPDIDSRAALLPGSLAIIMTILGTLLTALVVAREWERGTMEALLATPVTRFELLAGKFIPYFGLGSIALGLSVVVATVGLGVPLRGSIGALALVSGAFLAAALGFGLLISTATRNQFVASQAALVSGYLPAFQLSGLIFELRSMPAPIRALTSLLPARYFVEALQTVFLAGDVWSVLLPDTLALAGFAVFFLAVTARKTRVRLG